MELNYFIQFRNNLKNFEITPSGFQGDYYMKIESDVQLFKNFVTGEIREIYFKNDNNNVDHLKLNIGEVVTVSIDLSAFPNYYETLSDFITSNKYNVLSESFYIHELSYLHNANDPCKEIRNFITIQWLISFLQNLSIYEKNSKGSKELFFQKTDRICSILIDFSEEDILNLNISESVTELESHVFEKSDLEVRKKIFSNEMINLFSSNNVSFNELLSRWNEIEISYKNSFQIYLAEFSFQKIKTSSQEYFHELTDRIYSTIQKFSTYILAIPLAYIFILRFFDFSGQNFPKDSFLLTVGVLYFVIIWFVLLNNLSRAFESIEKDIVKFQDRIKNEQGLSEIVNDLETQNKKIIPNQKNKIFIIKVISILILFLVFSAYYFIHNQFICNFLSRLIND